MKIGVCLPYMKRGLNRQTFQDWCRIIDQGPFSSLSCGERVTGYSMEMRNILAFAAASKSFTVSAGDQRLSVAAAASRDDLKGTLYKQCHA